MKVIINALFMFSYLLLSLPINATTCPFNETTTQPGWVNNISAQEGVISGVAVELYNPKLHSDFFALRKQSAIRAKKALAQNLSSSIYNSILSNKSISDGKLVKNAQSIVEQVSELTLPDSHVEARWLDAKNCLLWSKVIVGTDIVDEYIDEIGDMKSEVNQTLDNSLAQSVLEELNAKQFYLNYEGFSQAVNQQAEFTYKGITKPVLSWMLDNDFSMLEPSLVHMSIYVDGMVSNFNTNVFETYMTENELSTDRMKYILSAFKQSQQSVHDLVTQKMSQEGLQPIYSARNSGIIFVSGVGNSRVKAPFALGLRFTKDQPFWNVPKVTNTYASEASLFTGAFSLLHLVTLYKRADLVELLLNEGFDPNFKDINGMSPAQYAVAIEDESMMKLYLASSTRLDGIYATSVQKTIYIAYHYLYQSSITSISSEYQKGMKESYGIDYKSTVLKNYKKALKKADKSNVKSAQRLLKQSNEALSAFWKDGKYTGEYDQHLTKQVIDKSIKRLTDMM